VSVDEPVHLPNCPIVRGVLGSCGCGGILGTKKKRKPKSAYERSQNANYMRDRRQRPKRIEGEEFRYDSIDHLPPIEIDSNGFAKKPPTVPDAWKYNFTLEQRKVRFMLMWNYAGGNWTLACQFAGVSRRIADEWLKTDTRFTPLIERARKEIADRMRLRLFQVAGLVPTPKPVPINAGALLGLIKEYGMELPPEFTVQAVAEEVAAPAPVVGNIPRPGSKPAGL
jgi:hypothetical protein